MPWPSSASPKPAPSAARGSCTSAPTTSSTGAGRSHTARATRPRRGAPTRSRSAAGEHAALAYCPDALVVRTAGLYGVHGSAAKGGNFVQRVLARAREQGRLRMVSDQRLSPTFTADLAQALVGAVEAAAVGPAAPHERGELLLARVQRGDPRDGRRRGADRRRRDRAARGSRGPAAERGPRARGGGRVRATAASPLARGARGLHEPRRTCVRLVRGGTSGRRANQRAVTRSGTSALTLSAEIRQRFDEFSRSQKDVGQFIVDHLDEAAFHTAEELARRANTSSSTVVRFAQALGFEGLPRAPGGGPRRVPARPRRRRGRGRRAQPAAVPDRPDRVRGGAGHGPRQRRGDRQEGGPGRGGRGGGPDLARGAHRALRDRSDGLLRELPAPPADAAGPACRGGREPKPGGTGAARQDRREHRPGRLLGGPARTRWWCAR